MLDTIIRASLRHRFLVLLLTAVFVGVGVRAMLILPVDAFPDTTPVQVQVNTSAAALSPQELEQLVTFPIEQAISGLPGLDEVRSISKLGLSQVTAIFEDGTDLYFARQLVNERLQTVDLPTGVPRPSMGPAATGLGEVYHYQVTGEGWSLQDLTTLHDWVIKPRLRSVPGVAEINTWGGKRKQYQVHVEPRRLLKYGVTLDDVYEALAKSNLTAGGGNLVRAGELHVVRGISLTTSTEEIGEVVLGAREGRPVRIRDVAEVRIGHEIRRGAVTSGGEGEAVLGLGFMLIGENSHEVTTRLRERMDEIRKDLPEGVEIIDLYDRTELVDRVLRTVQENLQEGALLVVAVLFLFLGGLRAGLIVASAIPLSMLFAFTAMEKVGIAGSLMSLGAIDFGLVVDSSVIMIENSVRRLAEAPEGSPTLETVEEAALEVRQPTMFGELIIAIVYLPILALEGIEGKLFRPMALTVIFALLGSMVLSLTLMPVLASLFLPAGNAERDNLLVRAAKAVYRPVVRTVLGARYAVILAAVVLLGIGTEIASTLGSEFIPRLSEMAVAINTVRLSGVSLEESVRYGTSIERVILAEFPDEVRHAWTRTGTAEVATDPMGIELSDVFITLHERSRWKKARTQAELVALLEETLQDLPGMRMIFTQPIEMRVNEMVAGIRSDLGVKLFGDDLEVLREKASEIEAVLKGIPGSADVYTEQITGQPMVEIHADQAALARYGVPARHVMEIVDALGSLKVGEIREGQRRFDLAVLLAERYRADPAALRAILVPTPEGAQIPLSRLATIRQVEGPSTITREWQKRRIVVQCNVRDRDIGTFVADARRAIRDLVQLPTGYHVDFGGQFEHLERARQRLSIVVPVALTLILILLYISTGSAANSLIIFTGAPFASLGGIVALWLRGMPFTISAGVGFVAVSGVAMLNGLVMVSTIRQLVMEGIDLRAAIERSALMRLRPVLMTALVAGLGFVPMMLNTGVGAEVQRPLATVVVGGVISDNLLTLLVLPALYLTFGTRDFGGGNTSPPESSSGEEEP
jgi:cobalt-zinc-cadmium resistance protein CzcA